MTTMQFCQFIFPHNPHELTVRHTQNIAVLSCYPKGEITQSLGRALTIAEGEGTFFGPQAESQFAALRQLFLAGESGVLFLPAHSPFYARMDSLSLVAKTGTILTYLFRFVEDRSLNRDGALGKAPTPFQFSGEGNA